LHIPTAATITMTTTDAPATAAAATATTATTATAETDSYAPANMQCKIAAGKLFWGQRHILHSS